MMGTRSILPARLRLRCLSLSAPDPRVGRALEAAILSADAVTRAAGSDGTGRGPGPGDGRASPDDLAWLGIAAVATGARDAGRRALEAVANAVPTSAAPADRQVYLLLVARYMAWTGDIAYVSAVHWPIVRRIAGDVPSSGVHRIDGAPPSPEHAARAAVFAELAAAADAVGDTSWPRAPRAVTADPSLAGLDPITALPGAPGVDAWHALSRGEADSGLDLLLEHAASVWRPLSEELDSPPVPPNHPDNPEDARAAAAVALPLVHGLLGAEADATRHRMVLRPRFPAGWDECLVERITLGDAEIALRYHRDDGDVEYRLEQLAGAVPVRLIFEPALPATEPLPVHVDDEEADLKWIRRGGRMIAPVQLMLDHERRVRFDVGTDHRIDH